MISNNSSHWGKVDKRYL